jgi:hypothetical protein
VNWRFGVLSPAARVNSGGELRKRIPTSFTTRIASCSRRVTPTLPLLSATLEWRAGCAERCMSGSGRRGREIVRLRLVSHSTPDGARLHLPGGGGRLGDAVRTDLASVERPYGQLLRRGGARSDHQVRRPRNLQHRPRAANSPTAISSASAIQFKDGIEMRNQRRNVTKLQREVLSIPLY